jgi:fluoride exporter
MIEVIYVSIGGFFGAISRYAVSKKIQENTKTGFPLGTLTVNLVGAFLLGVLFGAPISDPIYTLLGIGFMGAFTTFSTFKLESNELRKSGKTKFLYSYLLVSYLFGVLLAYLGLIIGKMI